MDIIHGLLRLLVVDLAVEASELCSVRLHGAVLDVVCSSTVGAVPDIRSRTAVLRVSELETSKALDEGAVILDSDSLMSDFETSEFKHPDSDGWGNFNDCVGRRLLFASSRGRPHGSFLRGPWTPGRWQVSFWGPLSLDAEVRTSLRTHMMVLRPDA